MLVEKLANYYPSHVKNLAMVEKTVLRYNFEVLVLCLSVSTFSYFILLLYYSSETNRILFTPSHLFDHFSYQLVTNTKYNQQINYDIIYVKLY